METNTLTVHGCCHWGHHACKYLWGSRKAKAQGGELKAVAISVETQEVSAPRMYWDLQVCILEVDRCQPVALTNRFENRLGRFHPKVGG